MADKSIPADEFVPDESIPVDEFVSDEDQQSALPVDLSGEPEYQSNDDLLRSGAKAIDSGAGLVGSAISGAFDIYDRFVTAPVRSAVSSVQNADITKPKEIVPNAVSAYWQQFAEDPAKAPRSSDIAEKAGLSKERSIRTPFRSLTGEDIKTSPAALGGTAVDVATDPFTYAGLWGPALGRSSAKAGAGALRKTASGILRVPEEDITKYMANAARIDKTADIYPRADVVSSMDSAVAQTRKEAEEARALAASKEADLATDYKELRQKLLKDNDHSIQAKDIKARLESEKASIGVSSDMADQALMDSGAIFTTDEIIKIIRQAQRKFGTTTNASGKVVPIKVGDKVSNAIKKLGTTAARINKQFPGMIDPTNPAVIRPGVLTGPELRDVLQQIRRDTDFEYGAGEYNSALDSMRKDVSFNINQMLKDKSRVELIDPDAVQQYIDIMDDIHKRSSNLARMSSSFGKETTAARNLEKLRKGQAVDVPYLQETVDNFARGSSNEDLLQSLEQRRKSIELAERMRKEDLRAKLFPDLHQELVDVHGTATMAEQQAEPLRPLGTHLDDKNADVTHRLSWKKPSASRSRAMEQLKNITGTDYPQIVDDLNVHDSFSKDRTAGSRMVSAAIAAGRALTGAAGGLAMHGSPVIAGIAGVVAPVLGLLADRYGGSVLKAGLKLAADTKNTLQKVPVLLNKGTLGAYEKVLIPAMKAGPAALNLQHKFLMNNDPEYYRLMTEDE
jgi:hypothetical protein